MAIRSKTRLPGRAGRGKKAAWALALAGAGGLGYWWWTQTRQEKPPLTTLEEILRRIGLVEKDVEKIAKAIRDLDKDVGKAQEDLDAAQDAASEISNALLRLSDLSERYEDLHEAMDVHLDRLEDSFADLQDLRDDLAEKLGEDAPEVQRLDSILQLSSQELTALKGDLVAAQQTGRVTAALLERARQQMTELEARLSALSDTLDDIQQRMAEVLAATKKLTDDVNDLKEDVERLQLVARSWVFEREATQTLGPLLQAAVAGQWSPPYTGLTATESGEKKAVNGQDDPPGAIGAEAKIGETWTDRAVRLRVRLGGVNIWQDSPDKGYYLCGYSEWKTFRFIAENESDGCGKEYSAQMASEEVAAEAVSACKCGYFAAGDHDDCLTVQVWVEARDANGKTLAKSSVLSKRACVRDPKYSPYDVPVGVHVDAQEVDLDLPGEGTYTLVLCTRAIPEICSVAGIDLVAGASCLLYPKSTLHGTGRAPTGAGDDVAPRFPDLPEGLGGPRRDDLNTLASQLVLGPVRAGWAAGIVVLPFDQTVRVRFTDEGSSSQFHTWPHIGFYVFGKTSRPIQKEEEYRGTGAAAMSGEVALSLPAGVYGVVAWAGGSFDRGGVGQITVSVDYEVYGF